MASPSAAATPHSESAAKSRRSPASSSVPLSARPAGTSRAGRWRAPGSGATPRSEDDHMGSLLTGYGVSLPGRPPDQLLRARSSAGARTGQRRGERQPDARAPLSRGRLPSRRSACRRSPRGPEELGDDRVALERRERARRRRTPAPSAPRTCRGARCRCSRACDSPGPFTTQPITATFISSTPGCAPRQTRHLLADVGLDVLGHLLEERRRRAPAAGARRHLRREAAEAQRLEDLLRDLHLLGAVAAGRGVSETRIVSPMPSCEEDRQAGGAGDDALRAHAPPR